MVCYSDRCKSISVKIVAVVSVIITILGLITAVLGAMQMGVVNLDKPVSWAGLPAIDQSGFGLGIMVVGAFAFLTGLLGCCTCKCKKACFTIPFVILSLILGLVLLIVGLLLIGVASTFVDKL